MRAMGMTTKHSQRLAGAYQDMAGKAEQARLAFLDHVLRPHAEQLARELRSDLSLRGEGYVHVGWDDVVQAPTAERIDPATIAPSLTYPPGPSPREPWRP